MRRRAVAIASAAAAVALGGGLLLAPTAQAEEEPTCNGLAYELDVVVNDEALVDEGGCLSLDGGGAPELPAPPTP